MHIECINWVCMSHRKTTETKSVNDLSWTLYLKYVTTCFYQIWTCFISHIYMYIIYKVICNYLHLNAGNASGSGLPQLLPACSTFSRLLIVLTGKTKKNKTTPLHTKHTTPNTTQHTNYKLQSRKSLNYRNSQSLSCLYLRHCCCHSSTGVPPTTSPVPQQPNHMVCHIIL